MNTDTSDRKAILDELDRLRTRMAELEKELAGLPETSWQATQYYTSYYATAGFFLGMFAAFASLLVNVIGSSLVDGHPLQLIQIYLTFPLGDKALEMDSGVALAMGCILYVGTGMLLGILFHLVMTKFTAKSSLGGRLILASVLAVALWLINFYGILSWLQPLLIGGNWILEMVPWYVAALTHLVFGWTMAILYPWGLYQPYKLQTET